MPEGPIRNYDGLTIKSTRPRRADLNRNFPSGWPEHEQVGAGDYPTRAQVKAMVDFIVSQEHRRGDQLHTQRRHPAADGNAERRRHDPGGPVGDQALQRDRRQDHRLSGDHIWHDFKYHPKDVISGTQDWVYEHLGAVLGGRDLGTEQGSRHRRSQVD
jgi:hypothetical protein